MNEYIDTLTRYAAENPPNYGRDAHTILEMLYCYYHECNTADSEAVMNAFGVDIVYNHADYRLMSKRALEALADFKEVNLFLRGIVPLIGFKTAKVFYERHERFAGESKYPLKKMLALAYDGITSFSVTPIKVITALGAIFTFLGCAGLLTLLILLICGVNVTVSHAILCSLWCICGLILLGIGVVGSYIGKVYMETKARPRYFIETFLD